ncbi:minor capsid protein [Paraburkholderia sp. SIMBA_050]
MHLEPIAALLEANNCGVRGESIFINEMRVEDSGLLLKASYKGTPIDPELPDYYKGTFALIARGKGYANTKAVIEAAMTVLKIEQETQVGELFVKYLRAKTLPISYPIPSSGMIEFVTNIDCAYVLTV